MSLQESLTELGRKLRSLRKQPSDYPALLWAVFVFLGGAIDAVAIKNFISWWVLVSNFLRERNITLQESPQAILSLVIFGLITFLFPIIFSFLFTRWHSEKRIVPPFYMQLVAFGLLLFLYTIYLLRTIFSQCIWWEPTSYLEGPFKTEL